MKKSRVEMHPNTKTLNATIMRMHSNDRKKPAKRVSFEELRDSRLETLSYSKTGFKAKMDLWRCHEPKRRQNNNRLSPGDSLNIQPMGSMHVCLGVILKLRKTWAELKVASYYYSFTCFY